MFNLYDFETKFQDFETKLKETVDGEEYEEIGKENPARVVTRIYVQMCRPQMYFGVDKKAEYEGVVDMMAQFIKDYPEFPEMQKFHTDFDTYVSEEFRK